MKKFYFLALSIALFVSQLAAQAPHGFNYQAVVRNSAGQILSNHEVGIQLNILQGSESGTSVYTYTGQLQTNANGTITIHVGENSAEYAAINWSNGPYFLRCEIDPTGGSNYLLSTTQQIMSVPYAEYAAVADRVSSSFSYDEQDPAFRNWNFDYDSLRNKPTRLSDFVNDLHLSDFNNDLDIHVNGDTLFFGDRYIIIPGGLSTIDWTNITNRPTHLSQFINDLVINWDSIVGRPDSLSQFFNDLNLSDFHNDMNFVFSGDTLFFGDQYIVIPSGLSTVDWANITNRPTQLSQFINDLVINWDSIVGRPDSLSQFINDLVINWNSIVGRPDSLSQFINDLNLSDFHNDMNFVFSGDTLFFGDQYVVINSGDTTIDWNNITNRPTHLSQFINDLNINYSGDTLIIGDDTVVLNRSVTTPGLSEVLAVNNNASLGITNLPWPTSPSDVANKEYADSAAALAAAAVMNSLYATIDSLRNRIDSLNNTIDSLTIVVNNPDVNIDSIMNVVDSLTHPQIQGGLIGRFSVGENRQVIFSQGNLQYNPSLELFRFAENQYDITRTDNDNISENTNVWLDLFGYGTSGWKGGRMCYRPIESNPTASQYIFVNSSNNDLTGYYVNADWGVYNRIINGYNQPGMWRTMSNSEWNYLLNYRNNASSLKTLATVNNIKGLIILPDNWTAPAGVNTSTFSMLNYTNLTCNTDLWRVLQNSGAVFLPAAGIRQSTVTSSDNETGVYWTSSYSGGNQSFTLLITTAGGTTMTQHNCSLGCSVRLVRDY